MAFALQLADNLLLVLRQDLCNSLVDTDLGADSLCGDAVVACDHNNLQTHVLQLSDSLLARRLDGVGDSDTAK